MVKLNLHNHCKYFFMFSRWGTWEEHDRRDNYLLLKPNSFYSESLNCAIPPMSVAAEVMFSDNVKSKSKFSNMQFSVSNANITCFKVGTKDVYKGGMLRKRQSTSSIKAILNNKSGSLN